jgi:hypothetical protein
MKLAALKCFIGLSGAFAGYYLYFLASVAYELYGPSARFCGTAQVWALQGAALIFAPTALLGAAGLWFAGRKKPPLGAAFPKIRQVSLVILILCALINSLIFLPVP